MVVISGLILLVVGLLLIYFTSDEHIEKEIDKMVKEKQSATYEVGIGKYKGNIEIHKKDKCWLCEEIKKGCYRMENSNKTLKLEIYKEQKSGDYIIQANGEDVLQQEINYCPMCGRKLV